jgi:ABC-type cobalamin transport system permease subunit
MSIAGIVVGSLGLIAVGAGIGLLVNPDEVVAEQPIFVNTTHPPGLVAVTIGSGVALTAALMLGAAHKGYKTHSTARVRVGPTGLRF